jgi:hypothetical protein
VSGFYSRSTQFRIPTSSLGKLPRWHFEISENCTLSYLFTNFLSLLTRWYRTFIVNTSSLNKQRICCKHKAPCQYIGPCSNIWKNTDQ